MRIISLGWGVQSFALAAMSALSVLPSVDAAVHADTGHERSETYALAEKWTPWLERHGVRVVTVQADNAAILVKVKTKSIMIPARSEKGLLRRQCTRDWKIAPIRRWLQANRDKQPVEQWLGITLDEVLRMKPSRVQYITYIYPFIEMFDRPWTRGMVIRWLVENGLDIPVKSSCVFCPYHDRQTWRDIQLGDHDDWQKACKVDSLIRNLGKKGYDLYLASQLRPLDDCDFRSQEDHGQLTLWDEEECSGMCFL